MTYFLGLLGFYELINITYLEQCPEYSKCLLRVCYYYWALPGYQVVRLPEKKKKHSTEDPNNMANQILICRWGWKMDYLSWQVGENIWKQSKES